MPKKAPMALCHGSKQASKQDGCQAVYWYFIKSLVNKSIVDARHLLEICRGKLFIEREKNYMEIKRLS